MSKQPPPGGVQYPDYYHRAVGVVPGYAELFGRSATFDDLLAIIRRYPVREWLSFLSRIQLLIAPPYHTDVKRHIAVFKGVVGHDVKDRLVAFERNCAPGTLLLTFIESQVSTLQQLVILHAPVRKGSTFCGSDDFDDLCRALLITWDLMHRNRNPEDVEAAFEAILQDMTRTSIESSQTLLARAYFVYQLHSSNPSSAARTLSGLFDRITGVNIRDYIFGGFSVLAKEIAQGIVDIKQGFATTVEPTACPNPKEAECLQAFHSIRCAPLATVRKEIERFDPGKETSDLSLIALSKYPIVEVGGLGRLVCNVTALAHAIFSGIRHAILAASLDGKSGIPNRQELGGLYGQILQDYALGILKGAFGDRLVRIREEDFDGMADCLIVYDDRILVVEIKNAFAAARGARGYMTFAQRTAQIEKLHIRKAAKQISKTIVALRAMRIADDRIPDYDWTISKIIPIIVTIEQLPQMWKMWRLYSPLIESIEQQPMSELIARTRFISMRDLELFPDLVDVCDLGRVLWQWANDEEHFECPLLFYCKRKAIPFRHRFLFERFREVSEALADRFGLDKSELTSLDQTQS